MDTGDTAPIARTPAPPYTAVIFTSVRTEGDTGYAAMSAAMDELARQQPGYLVRDYGPQAPT